MEKKNVIVIDGYTSEVQEFANGLKSIDKREWDIVTRTSSDRSSRIANAIRYVKYFLVGCELFIKRNQFNTIIAWQQFYGLIFALLCRFFHVRKQFSLVVMTVIYKDKEGALQGLYKRFYEYAIKSDYIDAMTCVTSAECGNYSRIFKIPNEKFHYISWGLKDNAACYNCKFDSKKYIFSAGTSNRDWDFVFNALGKSKYSVITVGAQTEYHNRYENINTLNHISNNEYYSLLANSYCVLLSIKDESISAGQITLLQAMQFRKPVIVTKSIGLSSDYIVNGENGIVVVKKKSEVLEALDRLYNDSDLYDKLSENARITYEKHYSSYQMGRKFGELLFEIRPCLKNSEA